MYRDCTSIASYTGSWDPFRVDLLPGSGELRTQKLKSYFMTTQSVKVFPRKPGVGQYIAMHATLAARDFFLANFYPSGLFTCIFFPKSSPELFLYWLWLTPVPV